MASRASSVVGGHTPHPAAPLSHTHMPSLLPHHPFTHMPRPPAPLSPTHTHTLPSAAGHRLHNTQGFTHVRERRFVGSIVDHVRPDVPKKADKGVSGEMEVQVDAIVMVSTTATASTRIPVVSERFSRPSTGRLASNGGRCCQREGAQRRRRMVTQDAVVSVAMYLPRVSCVSMMGACWMSMLMVTTTVCRATGTPPLCEGNKWTYECLTYPCRIAASSCHPPNCASSSVRPFMPLAPPTCPAPRPLPPGCVRRPAKGETTVGAPDHRHGHAVARPFVLGAGRDMVGTLDLPCHIQDPQGCSRHGVPGMSLSPPQH